jgi:16S rRNA processing protein RimM
MNKEDCYELGYIVKPLGLKGEMAVMLDVDFPEDYQDLESIFIEINGSLVPHTVDFLKINGNKISLQLEDINSVEKAEKLRTKKLYLPLEELPELEDGEYYLHELVGYQVIDKEHGQIGEVQVIYNLPAQDLLAVTHKGVEVMIPMNEAIIKEINHTQKTIYTQLPEGLLEIYTN